MSSESALGLFFLVTSSISFVHFPAIRKIRYNSSPNLWENLWFSENHLFKALLPALLSPSSWSKAIVQQHALFTLQVPLFNQAWPTLQNNTWVLWTNRGPEEYFRQASSSHNQTQFIAQSLIFLKPSFQSPPSSSPLPLQLVKSNRATTPFSPSKSRSLIRLGQRYKTILEFSEQTEVQKNISIMSILESPMYWFYH